MRSKVLFVGSLAITEALASGLVGPTDTRPEVLIVSTWHMANRGHDLYNVHADDVLSPKRQQEITQVIEALKKFHPTKIAIEADIDNQQIGQEYSDYLTGEVHTLSR